MNDDIGAKKEKEESKYAQGYGGLSDDGFGMVVADRIGNSQDDIRCKEANAFISLLNVRDEWYHFGRS